MYKHITISVELNSEKAEGPSNDPAYMLFRDSHGQDLGRNIITSIYKTKTFLNEESFC